jgi:hypothetical protein
MQNPSLSTTLVKFDEIVTHLKNEKNPPLLSMTLINWFERFVALLERNEKPITINDNRLICLKKQKNYFNLFCRKTTMGWMLA